MRTVSKRQGVIGIFQLARFYDLYHSQHLEDVPFWQELIDVYGSPVLELGCGTGRSLLPLAQAGTTIYGLDRDMGMLNFLIQHKSLPKNCHVFAADMAAFHLAMNFPLIIMPCNTYSTLNTQQRPHVLRQVKQHLSHLGCFSASLPNPHLMQQLTLESEAEIEEVLLPPDDHPIQISTAWSREGECLHFHYHYDTLFPDGLVERFTYTQTHWLMEPTVFLAELVQAGFDKITLYGDYDRSPYDEDSPYLILTASI